MYSAGEMRVTRYTDGNRAADRRLATAVGVTSYGLSARVMNVLSGLSA